MKIAYIKTEDLSMESLNAFQGKLKDLSSINFNKLWLSMVENGFSEPFVVWECKKDDKIYVIGGHQRLKVLLDKKSQGEELPDKFPCNFIECKNKKEAKLKILALTSQYGQITQDGLYEFSVENNIDNGFLKDRYTFPGMDLDGFVTDYFEQDPTIDDQKADDIPEIKKEEPITKLGDLWQLGDHRLLCGDCTIKENIERLMNGEKADMVFTDPPYGVSYADKNKFLNSIDKGNKNQKEIIQDHVNENEIQEFWLKAFELIRDNLNDINSYYITGPQIKGMMMMMMMMQKASLPYRHVIIWVKNNHVLGRCDYNYKHEPLFFGWTTKHKFYGKGEFKTSVWEVDKPLKNDLHPTMKPVRLIINALMNSSKQEQICFDPFLGSGSTLIACEKTDRKCYGMEIDPWYCTVIIKRWENHTNKKAKIIN